MIYYKEFDLPYVDIVQKKTLDYIKQHTHILTQELNYNWYPLDFEKFSNIVPEIYDPFKPLNLIPNKVALYVVQRIEKSYIHIDDFHQKARINFPILNCAGSFTNFYTDAKVVKFFNETNSVSNFKVINPSECVCIDRIEITKPVLLRVSEPHKVEVQAGNLLPRITLTIGFTTDPIGLLE